MHECEMVKSDKMEDCLLDKYGNFYCKSCYQQLDYVDIHPKIINKYSK